MEVKLPNIRKIFVPDPGHMLLDCDLSGADAQVVAWESNDSDLKNAFINGMNVHNKNGEDMFGAEYDPKAKPRKYTMRDEMKRGVHGTNYGSTARNLASVLGWSVSFAERFQRRWLDELHTPIRDWHSRIKFDLASTRQTRNRFGYKITWLDRPENCFTKALAWGPQSTVGIVCSRGGRRLRKYIPWSQLLLQVHDSLVFQVPFHRVTPSSLTELREVLRVEVPYVDPLVIPWGLAMSEKSWGDVKETEWPK